MKKLTQEEIDEAARLYAEWKNRVEIEAMTAGFSEERVPFKVREVARRKIDEGI